MSERNRSPSIASSLCTKATAKDKRPWNIHEESLIWFWLMVYFPGLWLSQKASTGAMAGFPQSQNPFVLYS